MAKITYKDSKGATIHRPLTNKEDFCSILSESTGGGLSEQKGVTKCDTLGGEDEYYQTFLSDRSVIRFPNLESEGGLV